jgi:hypothetical protein
LSFDFDSVLNGALEGCALRKTPRVILVLMTLWLVPFWISYLARPTALKCFEKSVCSPVPASVTNIVCAGEEWFGSMEGRVCFFRFTIAPDHFSELVNARGFERIERKEMRVNRPPQWFRPPEVGECFARKHAGLRKNAVEYLCMDDTGTNAWFALWVPDR